MKVLLEPFGPGALCGFGGLWLQGDLQVELKLWSTFLSAFSFFSLSSRSQSADLSYIRPAGSFFSPCSCTFVIWVKVLGAALSELAHELFDHP